MNRSFKHGHASHKKPTPEYRAWHSMKDRCYNPNNKYFKDYGGRGIIVCDRWKNSFENFLADLGFRPSNKHSLDRIENNGIYEPSNCRWATKNQQDNNRRTSVMLTLNEQTKPLGIWAQNLSLSANALWGRIYKYGWDLESALTTPKCPQNMRNKLGFRTPHQAQ